MPARILIVDDHEIVREGIRTLIARSRPDWEICGEASDGEKAIEAVRALKPDVVILDITMPKMSGLEAAAQLAKMDLGCHILIFTMHESDRLSMEVRQSHAQGFVLKTQAARDLIRAVDCLLRDGSFFGSECQPESNSQEPETSDLPQSSARCFTRLVFRPNSRVPFMKSGHSAPKVAVASGRGR